MWRAMLPFTDTPPTRVLCCCPTFDGTLLTTTCARNVNEAYSTGISTNCRATPTYVCATIDGLVLSGESHENNGEEGYGLIKRVGVVLGFVRWPRILATQHRPAADDTEVSSSVFPSQHRSLPHLYLLRVSRRSFGTRQCCTRYLCCSPVCCISI